MEEERGLRPGYPVWADRNPGRSSSKGDEGWRRRAVPNPKDKNPSSRAGSSVGGGSRSSLKKRRYQNPSESGDDSRPPDGKKREVFAGLGKTSGITSAGAWSARLEIANLLEIGCDPDHLVKLIRKGEEADYPLAPNGELRLVWVDKNGDICKRAKRRTSSPPPLASEADEGKSVASSVEEGSDVAAAVSPKLSLSGALGSMPPWVEQPGGLKEGAPSPQPLVDSKMSPPSSGFAKPAKPPGKTQLQAKKEQEGEEDFLGDESFKKKAVPPRENAPPVGKIPVVSTRAGIQPKSLAEKEVQDLKKFQEFALYFFGFLRVEGVEMDLLELVTKQDGTVNEDRFALHTSPNKASTGLRYSRLMRGLLEWLSEDERPRPKDHSVFNRLCLLEFIEWKIQDGCGAHTPKSILLAFDFFSKAFGYDAHGGHFGRAKRLSEKVARNPVQGRVGAPLFTREFLIALEDLVLDPFLPKPQRISAGKLRLCVQSSTRYDDIANTPLSQCEWVRRPGELDVVALRARSLRGKTGSRLWIASVMGVTEAGDRWLSTLVELLLEVHGQRWKTDDHMGKLPARDGKSSFDSPSRMEADVHVLKAALLNSGSVGKGLGISEDEVLGMRWHGSKATLVTVMQHLDVPARTVRFAGSWSCPQESMADLYLREAQLLTLDAQEKALKFLRLGGSVQGLIGEGILHLPTKGGQPMDKEATVNAMAEVETAVLTPASVKAEFFDEVFEKGLPDMEKVEKEVEKKPPKDDIEALLEELFEEDPVGDKSTVKRKEKAKETHQAAGEGSDKDEGEVEDESLVKHYLQVVKPTPSSKLHLPLPEHRTSALGSSRPIPRCGARGDYDYVGAEERLSAGLCIRCFGRGSCPSLCSFVMVDSEGTGVLRCSRRCNSEGDHEEHLCDFHK